MQVAHSPRQSLNTNCRFRTHPFNHLHPGKAPKIGRTSRKFTTDDKRGEDLRSPGSWKRNGRSLLLKGYGITVTACLMGGKQL